MDRTLDNMYFVQENSLKGTNTPSKVIAYLSISVEKGSLMVLPRIDRLAFARKPTAKEHTELNKLREGHLF